MTTLSEAQAACDRMLRDHATIDSYLRAQAGQPPTEPPTNPPDVPPTQPPSGDYELIEMPWANGYKDAVPIPANGTICIKVTVGSKPSPANNPPNLSVSNWGDGNFYRVACLSKTQNDFASPLPAMYGNNWPSPIVGMIQAIFSVITPHASVATVQANQTIWLNIKDTSGVDSQVRINLATKEV